ncbi:competence protein ComEC family protein [Patescibacteria group bacterium]|nr:competence protein ComEC family protein [Patescibacteria group bacterium]
MTKKINPPHNLCGGINTHEGVFWFCLSFLLGIFLFFIFNQNLYLVLLIILLIFSYFLLIRRNTFALFILIAILGVVYYQFFSYAQLENINIPFGTEGNFVGVVKNVKSFDKYQQLEVDLINIHKGKVSLNINLYPQFEYGDLIKFQGAINKFPEKYSNYFLSRGVFGQASFLNIELIEKNKGNFIKSKLVNFKEKIKTIFKTSIPKKQAAFLSGITIGSREDFSKEFEEKMSLSGTTHLMALSGYNISIIAWSVGLLLASFFSTAVSFYLSISVIILFVMMAGAEASIVRAAIMGIILLLSTQTERIFNPRNAIVVSAFIMVLFNPRVLLFDIGFQLSFAALLGIVYLSPVFKKLFKIQSPGFLSWKENMVITASAQIMALPILLSSFGTFSLGSILANILILGVIPFTMAIGFIMAGVGLFSVFLAKILGGLVSVLISYEFFIIDIFSKFTLLLKTQNITLTFCVIYYSLILIFILFFNKRNKNSS